MAELIGRTLGQYHILEEIGRGGMATVYRAEQPSLRRYVALKVLQPHLAGDTTLVVRFQREARTVARLQHPHIVTIYQVGQQGGYYFIAMEYLTGQPLNEVIRRRGALPLQRVVHMVQQVAAALDYAHGQGLIHRDIKPSNIIVGQGDSIKLTDFGIAKSRLDARLTMTGSILGTPYYMAPEQARGGAVDHRADIYSLGVVCYEMLTGRVPFGGATPAVLHAHVYETAPPLRSLNRRLPPEVQRVVGRALVKELGKRYRSAGELAAGLEAAARGKRVTPWPGEPIKPAAQVARQGVRKRRALFLYLGLAIAVLALAIGVGRPWVTPVLPTPISTSRVVERRPTDNSLPPTPTPMLGATCPPTSTWQTPQIVVDNTYNVRAGPGTDYGRVGQVQAGQTLDIVAKNSEGTWWQVCCVDGQQVWIKASLVQVMGPTDAVPVAASIPPTPTPAQRIASSKDDFSGSQGANSWEYLMEDDRNSGRFARFPRFQAYQSSDGKPARNCWLGNEQHVRICEEGEVHPGVTGRIAYMWHSNVNRQVRVQVHAHKIDTSCGDGVWVGTFTGQEKQGPNPVGEFRIGGADYAGRTANYSVQVNQDSYILVMVDIHRSSGCDQTRLYVDIY
jgi:serine/threonine protein kinase